MPSYHARQVLLARFDANCDGRMDMVEFVKFMQPQQHEQWRLNDAIVSAHVPIQLADSHAAVTMRE